MEPEIRLDERSDTIEFSRGGTLNIVGQLSMTGLTFLHSLLAARLFSAHLYGLFALALSVIELACTATLLGVDRGLVYFVAKRQDQHDRQTRLMHQGQRLVMVTGLIGSVLLIGLAPWLSGKVFHKPDLVGFLRTMAFGLPFYALSMVWLAATRGVKIMRYNVCVRKLVVPGIQVAAAVLAFLMGYRRLGLPIAYVTAVIAGSMVAWAGQHKVFGAHKPGVERTGMTRTLLAFSLPLMLANGLTLAAGRLDTLILGGLVGAQSIGIYTVGAQISLLSNIAHVPFMTMFAPMAADLWHRDERKRLERLYKTVTRWGFTVSLMLTALVILFRTEILTLFGRQFAVGTGILVVMTLSGLVHTATGPAGSLIVMAGYSRLGLFNSLLQVVTSAVFLWWLVPRHGLWGAAIAFMAWRVVINVAYLLEVSMLLRMHPYERAYLKSIIATALATCIVWLLQRSAVLSAMVPRVLVLGGLFVVLFALALYLLELEETELAVFRKTRQRLVSAARRVWDSLGQSGALHT